MTLLLAHFARWTVSGPAVRLAVLAFLVLAGTARPGWGQYGYSTQYYSARSYKPSESTPVNRVAVRGVGRTFSRGNLGSLASSTTPPPKPNPSPAAWKPFNQPRTSPGWRSTQLPDNRLFQKNRLGGSLTSGRGLISRPGSGSLLGGTSLGSRPTYQGIGAGWGGTTALSRTYNESLAGNWATGIPGLNPGRRTLNPRSFPNPQVVRKDEPSEPQPADQEPEADLGLPAEEATVSLDTLVSSRLSSRRRMHLTQGWEAFRVADYQAACREFMLADGYSSTNLAEQAEVRVALIYARVALQQFTEAGGSLKWLLTKYRDGGLAGGPAFADMMPDLPSMYIRRSELDRHLDVLRGNVARIETAIRTAMNDPGARGDLSLLRETLMEAKALLVAVEFAIPEARSRAMFEMEAFANAPEPWNALSSLLRSGGPQTDEVSPGAAAPAAQPAIEFPFNLLQETPPQALVVPLSTP